MRRVLLAGVFTFVFALGVVQRTEAGPITIQYEAEDVTDTTAADRWLYRYYVSYSDPLFTFDVDQGFAIYFGSSLYENLETPPPAVADWDPVVFQPDLGLGSDGLYDALALIADPGLPIPFTTLEFDWLGGPATPGSQFFEVYALIPDQNGGDPLLRILAEGETVPFATATPVPEPGSLLLLGAGCAGVARAIRRRRLPT